MLHVRSGNTRLGLTPVGSKLYSAGSSFQVDRSSLWLPKLIPVAVPAVAVSRWKTIPANPPENAPWLPPSVGPSGLTQAAIVHVAELNVAPGISMKLLSPLKCGATLPTPKPVY